MKMLYTPVKEYALEKGLKIFDNIINEYKELKKMGIKSIDNYINFDDDTIFKENLTNALKDEKE